MTYYVIITSSLRNHYVIGRDPSLLWSEWYKTVNLKNVFLYRSDIRRIGAKKSHHIPGSQCQHISRKVFEISPWPIRELYFENQPKLH